MIMGLGSKAKPTRYRNMASRDCHETRKTLYSQHMHLYIYLYLYTKVYL